MQIQVRINEDGVLRNQRNAFSNRYTLVSELLQNARRAGATRIDIRHDAAAKRLIVTDDGRGLTDFQKLLSFHESGWDAETHAEERPFGVGFSKCLYAATRCIVTSGRQRVDFDTQAALAKMSIDVEELTEGDPVNGTRVELHGIDLPDLGSRVELLCIGFGVPVWFNGRPLERAMAESRFQMQSTAIGAVHLVGIDDGQQTPYTAVFLQGFCVMWPNWTPKDGLNVLHLDSRQFTARLPDRDKLIDEDVQRVRIDAELKACWRRVLEDAKKKLPVDQFIDRYQKAMRAWGHLDLMNDFDVLPASLFEVVSGYPVQNDSGGRDYLRKVVTAPTRQEIEAGAVRLVILDPVNANNGAHWMLTRNQGWFVFDWCSVHIDHWVRKYLLFPDQEIASVTPVVEHARTTLDGRWVTPMVILCEAVRVRVGEDEALITDAGVAHEDVLYIPDGEGHGESVQQLSSFTDDSDQFLESDRDADVQSLADLLRLMRAIDPTSTLESLLSGLCLGKYPLLHGKTFQLSIGVGGAPGHSVSLLQSVMAGPGAGRMDEPRKPTEEIGGCDARP